MLASSTFYIPSPQTSPNDTAPMDQANRNAFLAKAEELASQGLRVIGLAQRFIDPSSVEGITREEAEREFIFLGLAGIFDPPRPETLGAVRACKAAGIVVHM